MDCKNILDMFTAYTENDLDPTATRFFEGHVSDCSHCARELSYFKKTVNRLRMLEPMPVPGDLLVGIHAKLEQEGLFKRCQRFWQETDFSMNWQTATATVLVAFTAMAIIKTFPVGQNRTDQLSPIVAKSEPATLPHRDFRLPSDSFHAASQRSTNFTAPISSFVSTKPRRSGNFSQPVAPESLYDTYTNIQPPGGLTRLFSPDMIITIHTDNARNKAVLLHSLTHGVSWQSRAYDDELHLYLPSNQISKLQQIFADHKMTFPPPGAQMVEFDANRDLLTVAIRLR